MKRVEKGDGTEMRREKNGDGMEIRRREERRTVTERR